MEYDNLSTYFIYFLGFFSIVFYIVSFCFFKFRFKKGNIILNEKYNLIIIHCITNVFDLIIIKNIYNYEYIEDKILITYLILFLFYSIQYNILKNEVEKLLLKNEIFDCDINFEFNNFWIFHLFFYLIIFPYQIFNYEISIIIKNIKIFFLLIYAIRYYIFLNNRMKEVIQLFNNKLESSETYLIIHIPNIKPYNLCVIYKRMQKIITVNLFIFILKSCLLFLMNKVDKDSISYIILENICIIFHEINFFSISLYLIYILYVFNKYNSEHKQLPIDDENIINLEDKKNELKINDDKIKEDELEEEEKEEQNEKEKEVEIEIEEQNEKEKEKDKVENNTIKINSEKESINQNNNIILELQDIKF